jgi:hypothetical protein
LAGDGQSFARSRQTFPYIYETKLREGISVEVQIKQLFEKHNYNTKLIATECRARKTFENVCRNFLDKELEENCS